MHSGPVAGCCAPALLSRNFPLRGQMVSRSRETTSEPVLKPESMRSRAETAGQRGRTLQGGGGTNGHPCPPEAGCVGRSRGAGAGTRARPSPSSASAGSHLLEWPSPRIPAKLLATPLSPAPLSHMGLEVPGDGMSRWGKVSSSRSPWFSYRHPRRAVTLGFLGSPASLGANPELTWKHPASEWAACHEVGHRPWGGPGVWLGDGG